jgi:predicted ATPase
MTDPARSLIPETGTSSHCRVRSVKIRNYKSIEKCAVELGRLTVLVGRNGSGKSNFLDALRFVADALQTSLDHAIKFRGGLEAVRRRSTGHPRNFALALDLDLPGCRKGTYGFEIAARAQGGFEVKWERLRITDLGRQPLAFYDIQDGSLRAQSSSMMPAVAADRLYLVNASGLAPFRPVYDALASMGFYNLNPDSMKELQSPDAGELLHRDGSNLASVLSRLSTDQPATVTRLNEYLQQIVPGIEGVARVALGPRETLEFRQQVRGSEHPWKFYAASMSDGTLRALGALVAVQQLADRKLPVTLVGIEEPETALHPGAAGVLIDALREASTRTQIVVTSHSPDLLDQIDLRHEVLLVVVSQEGNSAIAPPDSASATALKEHLYNAGDLLRMDQLGPDTQNLAAQRQLPLFEDDGDET